MANWLILGICWTLIIRAKAQVTGYDRQGLQRLTEFRQSHRKTMDGRLCAAAFVQNDVTYTGCTVARAPDGTSGRAWCYVEVQLLGKGSRDWDYCRDTVDYDAVRSSARVICRRKALQLGAVVRQLEDKALYVLSTVCTREVRTAFNFGYRRVQKTLRIYRNVCSPDDALLGRTSAMEEIFRQASQSIRQAQAGLLSIENIQQSIATAKEYSTKKASELKRSGLNCSGKGLNGYEDEQAGNGLRTSFFSNSEFRGEPAAYMDNGIINNAWSEVSPAPGVPIQEFSVRWEGYLTVPTTRSVQLFTLADCGARAFLDGRPIIADRMPAFLGSSTYSDPYVRVLPPGGIFQGTVKTLSPPQRLIGGHRHHLRVEYFHLSAFKYRKQNKAAISLGWRSLLMKEELIQEINLSKSSTGKPLTISGLPGQDYRISSLKNGALAFIDSTDYYVADVPAYYEGATLIRTNAVPTSRIVSFESSTDAHLHVAIPKGGSFTLNQEKTNMQSLTFAKADDTLSVYLAGHHSARAVQQIPFEVFSALCFAGPVSVSLPAGTSFFFFLSPASTVGKIQCEPQQDVISVPSGRAFKGCSSSSHLSGLYDCTAGLSGRNMDLPFGTWKTQPGRSLGEFLVVTFRYPVEVSAFQFRTLDDTASVPTEITLQFSGTQASQKVPIQTGDHIYELQPQTTRMIVATVTGMPLPSAVAGTGGSFAFIGSVCHKAGSASGLENSEKSVSILFGRHTGHALPAGAYLDDGSVKHARGRVYFGWDHTAVVAECVDPRRSGHGVVFPNPHCSETDKLRSNANCSFPNTWSIDVTSYGIYRITAVIGASCGSDGHQLNNLYINGIPFIQGESLAPGQHSTVVGLLTVSATPQVFLSSDSQTTLQSLKIEKVKNIAHHISIARK